MIHAKFISPIDFSCAGDNDVEALIVGYVKEIEELR